MLEELVKHGWVSNLVLLFIVVFLAYTTYHQASDAKNYRQQLDQLQAIVANRDLAVNKFVEELRGLNEPKTNQVLSRYTVKPQ